MVVREGTEVRDAVVVLRGEENQFKGGDIKE